MTDERSSPVALPRRRLGRSDIDITTVGLGCWALGGGGWAHGWGPQDDQQSIRTIEHAVELGINWIDTAAIYGLGHSEEIVGRALKDMPRSRRPYVFTKCGLIWDESEPMAEAQRILQPETVREEVEASLRRLGIDRIDLYQVHWPPTEDGYNLQQAWAAMADLVHEGKVRAIGVSNFDIPLLETCESVRHVDCLQPPLSIIHREAAEELIPWCHENEIGVVVYSPMQSVLLTNGFDSERLAALAVDDWRRRSPDFQTPALERNLALRDALRPLAFDRQAFVEEIAIAWTLTWPGVTGAIVGARSPEQVDTWIAGASLDLSSEDLDRIAAAIEETGAGAGPLRPAMTQAIE